MIQLSFHGAAGTVTGSKYLLRTDDSAVLIDCGVFQGRRQLRQLNWDPPPFDPAEISGIILTHAHIDHIGYLPRLAKQGFRGKAYCTAPTADLAVISLLDSAHIQEEDADFRNRKKLTHHKKALPLFTKADAETAINQMHPVPYDDWVSITDNVRFRMRPAGHILGAASVELEVADKGRTIQILFSGDIGRYGNPLTRDPGEPSNCDYLICESTYGGRLHAPEDPRSVFIDLVREIVEREGILLIPAFAVGRTQQITYLINELTRHDLIPPIDVHIDSPMAISVTGTYCKFHDYHAIDLKQMGGHGCVLEGKRVFLHRSRQSSMELNRLKGPSIVLSASGMLTGGRILHHLIHRLPGPNNIVALAGFMAEGTLGRRLADGATEIRIHKRPVEVGAKVVVMQGLSGHADFHELLHWLEPITNAPSRVFVTHGEKQQSEAMAQHIKEERGWDCHIPTLHETVEL
ncbi:MAG: MBL fold metallo-hydrolase [Candidatus Zixiibacteriota bacterium]|nr:MAG: MBL fold metallo-hydrolase [candidate division Zixibacteria bacterium]